MVGIPLENDSSLVQIIHIVDTEMLGCIFFSFLLNSYVTSGGPVNVIYLKIFHREISSNSPIITEKSLVAKLSLSRLQELASFFQRFISIGHNLNWL